jgi:hypothetical protein
LVGREKEGDYFTFHCLILYFLDGSYLSYLPTIGYAWFDGKKEEEKIYEISE